MQIGHDRPPKNKKETPPSVGAGDTSRLLTEEAGITRRAFVEGVLSVAGGLAVASVVSSIDRAATSERSHEPNPLERQKALFEKMSQAELAQWILESSGDAATPEKPVRTPNNTAAYIDLKNMADGEPAYKQTLLALDGETIKLAVEVNRDILMFRALLVTTLQDPANYFEGQPILVQSGQLTNRSGSHKGRQDKSHFYGNSIDLSGALINGAASDNDPSNLHPYDSPINQQLGRIIDQVGKLVGVTSSSSPKSLERVDSLHGKPELSRGHYHLNAGSASATKHAARVKVSMKGQSKFELNSPILTDLQASGISPEGRGFIHTYETFRSTTYGDAHPGGTPTIGYGATYYLEGTIITRNGQPVIIEGENEKPQMGDAITQEEADKLSKHMIEKKYLPPVVAALTQKGMSVTQHQLDALVSYSFHRGPGNVAKLINQLHKIAQAGDGNDALAIKAAFMHDINGPVAEQFRQGVGRRYLDTADIFMDGDYQRQSRPIDLTAWAAIIATYCK